MDSNGGETGLNSNGSRKRRTAIPDEESRLTLRLSLATYEPAGNTNPPYTTPSGEDPAVPFQHRRPRRNPSRTPPSGKSATVPAIYPWSGESRATVRSLSYLLANNILSVSGDVQCKKCEHKFTIEFDLEEKFREISTFIVENKSQLFQRAPVAWSIPALPKCVHCNQENCAKPLISEKKRGVNWLFLFLGQMLGCCTLEQLKYFCKHTRTHRTGAKDRVLYLTYMGLCKQLDPDGPYDI